MTAKKGMWTGRFAEETSEQVREFTESVSYDKALYKEDIAGSKAHARMLAAQGILSSEDATSICAGLDQVEKEISEGLFSWDSALEDVHMNIESRLTQIIGECGKKLHTGRSRNDQVALDFRLFVANRSKAWRKLLCELIESLLQQALQHKDTLLPGYTHLQAAQPVSLAQHLLAYVSMLQRDVDRLLDAEKRIQVSPLGAAALAGTTYPLDPFMVANELGFEKVFQNSMDAVSDRDFVVETVFCASLIMAHLSRFCEDMILWSNPLFGFIILPDAYATGSSIMPQKKNPDTMELTRGKTGRVYGSLMGLLTLIKGLPMTYNRDLQEDKEPFFDTDRTVSMSLKLMTGFVQGLSFCKENMRFALAKGYVNATELADYLVSKGVAFRQAHHYTGSLVAQAEKKGIALEELSLEDMQAVCSLIQDDVYPLLQAEAAVERRSTWGGTSSASVDQQVVQITDWLDKQQQEK